jgi:flavin reductase (DIM6/NTAB) family NADH-FMN oxidoreductase RutF
MDLDVFRTVLRRFATGVAVVTTWDHERPWGTTVNTFASVSLRPPLVLVAFDRGRRIVPALRITGRYAVNILAEDQQALSDCFAGGPGLVGPNGSALRNRGELCGAPWRHGSTGLPILEDAIASLECTVVDTHPAGDHDLFIAHVDTAQADRPPVADASVARYGVDPDQPMPLLYYSGRYLRIEHATSHELEGKPEH